MPIIPTIIILLTGFEPFNKEKINSSWEAVSKLNNESNEIILSPSEKTQAKIIVHELPCVFGKAEEDLIAKLKRQILQ